MDSSMVVGDLHDVNFHFPVRELQNDRVKVVPFATAPHAELFFQGSVNYPELYQYLPYGPYKSATEFVETLIEGRILPNPGNTLYAIIDKTRGHPDSPSPSQADFAGVIGYLNTDVNNIKTEIGFIKILPPFQRTHVTTNAVGLLMQYALNQPSHVHAPGLGLRRVQWQANALNLKSIRVAERMGFKREGTLRWDRALPAGKGKVGNGAQLREGDPEPERVGRHTTILATRKDDGSRFPVDPSGHADYSLSATEVTVALERTRGCIRSTVLAVNLLTPRLSIRNKYSYEE